MKYNVLSLGFLFNSVAALADVGSSKQPYTEVFVKGGVSSWAGDAKNQDNAKAFGLGLRRSFDSTDGFSPYLELTFTREKLDDKGLLITSDGKTLSTLSTIALLAGGCKYLSTDLAFCGGLGFGNSHLYRDDSSSMLGTPVLDVSLRYESDAFTVGLGSELKGVEVAQNGEQKKASDVLSTLRVGYKFY